MVSHKKKINETRHPQWAICLDHPLAARYLRVPVLDPPNKRCPRRQKCQIIIELLGRIHRLWVKGPSALESLFIQAQRILNSAETSFALKRLLNGWSQHFVPTGSCSCLFSSIKHWMVIDDLESKNLAYLHRADLAEARNYWFEPWTISPKGLASLSTEKH